MARSCLKFQSRILYVHVQAAGIVYPGHVSHHSSQLASTFLFIAYSFYLVTWTRCVLTVQLFSAVRLSSRLPSRVCFCDTVYVTLALYDFPSPRLSIFHSSSLSFIRHHSIGFPGPFPAISDCP